MIKVNPIQSTSSGIYSKSDTSSDSLTNKTLKKTSKNIKPIKPIPYDVPFSTKKKCENSLEKIFKKQL